MAPDGFPGDREMARKAEAGWPTQRTVVDPELARRSVVKPPAAQGSPPGRTTGGSVTDGLITSNSVYAVAGSDRPYDEGAMGTILLAHDESLGRTVVLKVLKEEHRDNIELRERFRREAAITAQLQHPGVPPVFSLGCLSDSRPFFSMKLVEGRTLAQLLRDCRDLERERPRLLTIFEQICQTVAYAHARGVIHRDLKPLNVVVGEYGSVYVMDWGIARVLRPSGGEADPGPERVQGFLSTEKTAAVSAADRGLGGETEDPSLTVAGDRLGTPQYMAPEQAAGDPVQDERVDVFSLGAILFEILTGGPLRPVTTVSINDLDDYANAYVAISLPAVDTIRADSPLVSLARRCLDRDPQQRPRTAADVAAEVTAYLLHVLQRPEREMARFFELSLDLFCLAGLDGYFKQINQNFTRVLGYSTAELLARPFIDYVHPDDHDQTRHQVQRLAQGLPVVQFENRYRDRWGNYKWFQWTAKSVPAEGIIFAVAREITERKHLEQRLQAIVESSPVAMVISNKDGLITQLNREAESLFGYDRKELVGNPVEVLIPERFRHGHPALRAGFLSNPQVRPGSGRELWGLRKDGAEIPIELGLSPLETEEGIFVISVITDVTESKRQERWFKALVESFPAGLIVIDRAGVIGLVNKETERLFGYPRGELIGRGLGLLFPEQSCDADPQSPDRFLAYRNGECGEIRGRRKDGGELCIEVELHPMESGERVLVVKAILDLTCPGRG
jgi:PAS domain S-box-containing protein